MSGKRTNQKGRTRTPSFVMLRFDIMDSPAWLALSPTAQALWCRIRRRYNGSNNGEIPLSCREAADLLNIGKTTASNCFIELQTKGFIKIGQYSDFRLKLKRSTRWILTDEPYNHQGPTNEWRAWKPDSDPIKI